MLFHVHKALGTSTATKHIMIFMKSCQENRTQRMVIDVGVNSAACKTAHPRGRAHLLSWESLGFRVGGNFQVLTPWVIACFA